MTTGKDDVPNPFDFTEEERAALEPGELRRRHEAYVDAAPTLEENRARWKAFLAWTDVEYEKVHGPIRPGDISREKGRFPIIVEITGRELPDGTFETYDPPIQPPTWDAKKIWDYDENGNLLRPEDEEHA